jgi:hypothetical protein
VTGVQTCALPISIVIFADPAVEGNTFMGIELNQKISPIIRMVEPQRRANFLIGSSSMQAPKIEIGCKLHPQTPDFPDYSQASSAHPTHPVRIVI